MAKKDPAFLFYTSDFLTETISMNLKERGQYITLICLQHQRGHLTLKEMKKVVGALSEEVMSKFITDDEGKYYIESVEIEINRRAAHSQKQKENIRKRWNKNGSANGITKKDFGNTFGNTVVLPLETETETVTETETEIEKKKESKRGSGGKREIFTTPTVEEVAEYCKERGNRVDAAHFVDYYTANGWKVGKQNMKDWKAAVRTWERNGYDNGQKVRKNADVLLESIRKDLENDADRSKGLYVSDVTALDKLQST